MSDDKKQVLLKYGTELEKEINELKNKRYPHLSMTAFFLELAKKAIEEDKKK